MSRIVEALALDCEMVEGKRSKRMLAQVAIVDEYGKCVYNYYVKQQNVLNYKTDLTGITPNHLQSGKQYQTVRSEVADLIRGRILVGHSLHNDLKALGLSHPDWMKRDTAYYFRTKKGTPSLKNLAKWHLHWTIQNGAHSALQDARATMRIYKKFEDEWEQQYESENDNDNEDYIDDYYYYDDDEGSDFDEDAHDFGGCYWD